MIEVELKEYLSNFTGQFKEALLKHELYGIEEFDNLLSSIKTISDGIEANPDVFIPINEHIIDKYGLGEMVIKFINSGYNYKTLAEILTTQSGVSINQKNIKEWVENYSTLTYKKRPQGHGNLFDVQERMQDIYSRLLEHLQTVEKTSQNEFLQAKITKQQVTLDIYKEIRMLTKDAANIMQAISHQAQLQEFRKVILESIKEVSPATAQAIIRKLRQNKAIASALLPGD